MAKVVFKSYTPNDNLLLPPCLGDYLPQNHPARVVSAMIDRLDISEIEAGYAGGGTSSYNPRMLLKVIVYAYLNNVYSGRRHQNACCEHPRDRASRPCQLLLAQKSRPEAAA